MSASVKVLILRTAGTNCDQETGFAFAHFGADVSFVHVKQLVAGHEHLDQYQILAIPGGFTYGDDIESGRLLANELRLYLQDALGQFLAQKKLIIGICNGFQVLVKAGILPGGDDPLDDAEYQSASLITNDSGKFEDRWTHLKVGAQKIWTEGLGHQVYFPVAHAEGKFAVQDEKVLAQLKANGQIAFRYCSAEGETPVYPENPNGSVENIAGITDKTGQVLGLMPHPERHFFGIHHPFWTRFERLSEYGDGAKIFENGVKYAQQL